MKKEISLNNLNIYLICLLPVCLFVGTLISNLMVIIIVFFYLLVCFKEKNFYFLKDNNFRFLVIIYLYLICNAIFIAENNESIIRALGFIRFVLLAYAISFYLNKNENKIIKFWSFIFLIVSIDLMLEYFNGQNILGFSANYPGRLAGFTGDELKIGGYYFGFIFLALSYFNNFNKKLFFILLITFLITSLLIGERSNFLKIVLMCFIFVSVVYKKPFYKKFLAFAIFSLISILIIINTPALKSKFYFHIFKDVIQLFKEEKLNKENLIKKNNHFPHYNDALAIFKNNPWYGVGLKKFRYEKNVMTTHPHQTHFELLSELGLIGYILILSNIIFLLWRRKYLKNNLYKISSILFLVATLIPILPSGSFFTSYTATIFWINYSFLINYKQNV